MDRLTKAMAFIILGAIALWFLFWRKLSSGLPVVNTTGSNASAAQPNKPLQTDPSADPSFKPTIDLHPPPAHQDAIKQIDTAAKEGASVLANVPGAGTIAKVYAPLVDAVAKMFGRPLDPVVNLLLTEQANPPVKSDTLQGGPVYVVSLDGYKHRLDDEINHAGYSYRDIIAVEHQYLALFPDGPPVTGPNQIQRAGRPIGQKGEPPVLPGDDELAKYYAPDMEAIRSSFGNTAIFKVGKWEKVHGPWEVNLVWNVNSNTWVPTPPPAFISGPTGLDWTLKTIAASQTGQPLPPPAPSNIVDAAGTIRTASGAIVFQNPFIRR